MLIALASQDTSFTVWHEALQRPLFIGAKLFKWAARRRPCIPPLELRYRACSSAAMLQLESSLMQQCGSSFLGRPARMLAEVRACQIYLWYGGQSVSERAGTPNSMKRTFLPAPRFLLLVSA